LRSLGQNVAAGLVKARPAPEGAIGPDGEFTKEFLDQMEKEARDTVRNNPLVYHYCGFDAFVGIVKNRELWATNTFYLNDREETIHAINMYLDAVEYIQANDKDKANIYRFLYRFLSQRAPANIFVCCFSQQGTQLSQWRAYAPKGGISVGFHVDKLAKLADDKTVFFRPVLYHPVEQLKLVLPEVSKLIGKLPDYLPKNEGPIYVCDPTRSAASGRNPTCGSKVIESRPIPW